MNEQTKSIIVLHRTNDSVGVMRDLQVFINNQKVGVLPYGAQKEFHLVPGNHDVQVSMDWCRSNPIRVELGVGESLDLYCGSRFVGKRWLLNIFAALFCPRKLFFVTRKSNTEMLTVSEDRQQRARILAFTFTPLLMIPFLALVRVAFTQVVGFSKNLGSYSDFLIPLCGFISLVMIVLFAIYCWRWLKNFFEHK